ncbi:ornithine cyclodeaminase family protein [Streptomyces sp. HNM0645]|uniref:ornithine cyclodeaminase family protein n=1 Tax=Streptomyces sp. HNM0645 TaxID=2782343 RepID=UPI0024B6E88E|nr:ornithine cyclodeaminase family protein [Streptomyces sp. HNM0645]MDI9888142.1 ornithine cyclodeaminase family protein [Streptomyces sp. HNM0645]
MKARATEPRHLGAADVARLLTPSAAADAVEAALLGGIDPEEGPHRTQLPLPSGQLLLMPAAADGIAGVKIAGIAPANPARGLPRITGSYLLLDGATLMPLALLDAAALTALRTPAVSAVALRHLAAPDARHAVIFGAGPQAYGHLEAALAERPLTRITVVSRRTESAEALAAHARALGPHARTGTPGDVTGADLVLCCTTARQPLFDGRLVPDHATVVAVGSHEPDARETDTALVRRSAVYVEARTAARREAGDILLPEAEGAVGPDHIRGTLADLATGRARPAAGCPQLFKSVGMAWEDLAVAAAVHSAATTEEGGET